MSFFERVNKFVVVWTLSILFSILVAVRLIFAYIVHCTSIPWKPKDRILMEQPACFSDPTYGTHKYATVNRIRLHYVESGDKSKPLMIFVHGFPEMWYSWRHQITEFNKEYWVVAIDQRGYNQSEKPRGKHNYKIENMIVDLRALVHHLNRKQCILVAHDWGAFVGWEFVEQNKEMVQKYVMMGVPSRRQYYKLALSTMDQFKRSWYFFVFKFPYLAEELLTAGDYAIFYEMWNRKFTDNFTEDDLEAYKYVFSKSGAITAALNYYRANSSFICEPAREKDDGAKGMFILGQRDAAISHAACIVMANECPKLRVEVIPGANHFVHQDAPKATNTLIHDFLGPASNYKVETLT
ncbi:epoxide hydrolase 1-like [Sitodiplosis mosellana]|uniref:epoxide hydrolase 1-like n=1 Tax=Sitodiplosis mosellana TaxID=263140 RepID=UPI002443B622|nr:epoxide hydrolase 1-like [Sitodiplosis mosellana]